MPFSPSLKKKIYLLSADKQEKLVNEHFFSFMETSYIQNIFNIILATNGINGNMIKL